MGSLVFSTLVGRLLVLVSTYFRLGTDGTTSASILHRLLRL